MQYTLLHAHTWKTHRPRIQTCRHISYDSKTSIHGTAVIYTTRIHTEYRVQQMICPRHIREVGAIELNCLNQGGTHVMSTYMHTFHHNVLRIKCPVKICSYVAVYGRTLKALDSSHPSLKSLDRKYCRLTGSMTKPCPFTAGKVATVAIVAAVAALLALKC